MPNLTCNYSSHLEWNYSTKILTKKIKNTFAKSPSTIPIYKVGYLRRTGYCFQCRHKASAWESVITRRKKVRWKWASYHLRITKCFAYYHLLSSPSPSMATRGTHAALKLCLGLFKWRPVAMSFRPIYSCWLLIFIASYLVRENLSWCYANYLHFGFGNQTES